MDPQQRLLLERGYEALHATELRRAELMGSATGVFLGIAGHDFVEVLKASPAGRSVYAATGSSHSIAAGRLSFVLGLQGPCVSYDTACSSALAAGHASDTVTAAVQIGVDLGPNLSITGSLATLLWLTALRREGHMVGAGTFLKTGALVMPLALLPALAVLR